MTIARMPRTVFASLLLPAVLAVIGCGTRDGLVPVSGRVTYNGDPLSEGRIQFRSLEDHRAFAGMITDGEYELRAAPGEMAVEIRASRLVEGKFEEVNPGELDQVGEMYIPEKYNSRTELKATVAANEELNFDLTGP